MGAGVKRALAELAAELEADEGNKKAGKGKQVSGESAGRAEHLTDLGNARRLVQQHGDDLRYNFASDKWFVWDGTRWSEDVSGEVMRRAKRTARSILNEAAAVTDDDDSHRALLSWHRQSEMHSKLKAMLGQAQSEEGIPVDVNAFDADPLLLNCLNGTLDLRTGELREHRREDMLTKTAPVNYRAGASAPLWEAFLDRVFDGSLSLIEFIQRAAGYSLTGDTGEQCIFIPHGAGANGKSTYLEVMRYFLGGYAQQTPPETLLTRRSTGVPNDIARLRGARLVTAVESGDGQRLAENLVKQLTGGDTVTARFLFKEFFEYRPVFKLWLATNHKPQVRGTEDAIWRRIRLVPFEVVIPPAERDPQLKTKLLGEAEGILAWAVQGCLKWRRNGLGMPEEVRAASSAYRAEMDVLAGFISDECVVDERLTAKAGELYRAYRLWCEANGEPPATQTSFGLKLAQRGYRAGRNAKGRHWIGLGLLERRECDAH
jgi:putative DNA primase/helicase